MTKRLHDGRWKTKRKGWGEGRYVLHDCGCWGYWQLVAWRLNGGEWHKVHGNARRNVGGFELTIDAKKGDLQAKPVDAGENYMIATTCFHCGDPAMPETHGFDPRCEKHRDV